MANGDQQSDLVSNPNFLTPEQIQQQRDYAMMLLRSSQDNPAVGRSGPFEAVSPWGGAVMAGQGLMGNLLMARAGQQQKQSIDLAAQSGRRAMPSPLDPSGQAGLAQDVTASAQGAAGAGAGGPQSFTSAYDSATGGSKPWQASIPAIAQIESSNNPNARTGSYTGVFQMGPEERRKYGGDSYNSGVRMLSDEAQQLRTMLHREPTGGEVYLAHQQGISGFAAHMSNPDAPAWQNMAATDEGKEKGVGWAKRAIWGNVPDSMKARFGSVDHITSRDFTNMWMNRVDSGSFSGPSGTSAMQFSGEPAPDGQSAIAMALQGGGRGRGAPSPTAPSPYPQAPGAPVYPGGQYVPPEAFPQRLGVSGKGYQDAIGLAGRYLPPDVRQNITAGYLTQHLPAAMQYPGGTLIGTMGGRGPQVAIPELQHMPIDIEGAGKFQVPYTMMPGGGIQYPGGGAAPAPAAPAAPNQPRSRLDAIIQGGTGALPYAEDTSGPLSTPPPPAGPAGTKVAQAQAPGILPPFVQSMVDWGRQQKALTTQSTEGVKEATKGGTDFYNTLGDRAGAAAQQVPDLAIARHIVDDPNFYSGFAADPVLAFKKAYAAMTGDTEAAAPMEVFKKLMAGINLTDLKTKLAGMGQIRVFEGALVSTSNAHLDNSVAANRALLDYASAVNQRLLEANDLANEYREAHKNDPGGVDFQTMKNAITKYYEDKPLMSDSKIAQYYVDMGVRIPDNLQKALKDKGLSIPSKSNVQPGPPGALGTKPPQQGQLDPATEELRRQVQEELNQRKQKALTAAPTPGL